MHRIALVGIGESDLADIVDTVLPEHTSVETRSSAGGVHLDPASAVVVVPALATIAAAAISAIATVWAAKVTARAAKKADVPKEDAIPSIEIETLAGSIVIPVREGFEVNLAGALPESSRSILTVRFLERMPRGGC